MPTPRRKLIEVALPLDAINRESAREKSIRHGHPSTLHLWWARRPLAACRAVLFGQLVDDPSSWPDQFPTEKDQDRERQRIFRLIEELVRWENIDNATILEAAQQEIARSFARARVADGTGDGRDEAIVSGEAGRADIAAYLREVVPPVHDPFAGGGSIPLEAQRLGLRAIATDLNPVAVLINKALIEIPPRFAGKAPVGPIPPGKKQGRMPKRWPRATGLAEDVRRYGEWMRAQAHNRIGHLYPDVELPKKHGGGKATVIAWIWARTVESPNPAFRGVHVPLVSSFWLGKKKGKEAWVEPVVNGKEWHFEVRNGKPADPKAVGNGTKQGRGAHFRCILSGAPIEPDYVKSEGAAGRMGARLMAVAAEGNRRRIYTAPTESMEAAAAAARPSWSPEAALPDDPRNFWTINYGLVGFADLFTNRQLVALATFSDLVGEARDLVAQSARAAGWPDNGKGLEAGGSGATAYGDAVATYLALGLGRSADYWSSVCTWHSGVKMEALRNTFARQAIPMTWDFAEGNPFSDSSGNFLNNLDWVVRVLRKWTHGPTATVRQADARTHLQEFAVVLVSTDPPYYDNIGYADLSDFFYVWLRHALRESFPSLFRTMLVPKGEELVATPYRHGGREAADSFFLDGMREVLERVAGIADEATPLAIYYAFRQSETRTGGTSSTGWETFLQALIDAGLLIDGTWPMRTEMSNKVIGIKANILASSIIISCRPRGHSATVTTRAGLVRLLRRELPRALRVMEKGSVAPVDLAQASIGPGMAIFSRHKAILEADDQPMTVRAALQLINQVVDEIRGEEEVDLDRDTRFAIKWFETYQWAEGEYGDAEVLANAMAVSVDGVARAGICKAVARKVRLLSRAELPKGWDPQQDDRLTVWEATQHLIKCLEEEGEGAAAALLHRLEDTADAARVLAYRLYTACERRGWAEEARAYNGLVVAWPDLERLGPGSGPFGSGKQLDLV